MDGIDIVVPTSPPSAAVILKAGIAHIRGKVYAYDDQILHIPANMSRERHGRVDSVWLECSVDGVIARLQVGIPAAQPTALEPLDNEHVVELAIAEIDVRYVFTTIREQDIHILESFFRQVQPRTVWCIPAKPKPKGYMVSNLCAAGYPYETPFTLEASAVEYANLLLSKLDFETEPSVTTTMESHGLVEYVQKGDQAGSPRVYARIRAVHDDREPQREFPQRT
jgi:hypothetical protein